MTFHRLDHIGSVYFMKPIGMDGPVKIGWTSLLDRRLESLSVWSPFPLEVMASVPGTLADELYLHRCFAPDHLHHEWFTVTDRMLRAIDKIKTHGRVGGACDEIKPLGNIRGRRGPLVIGEVAA